MEDILRRLTREEVSKERTVRKGGQGGKGAVFGNVGFPVTTDAFFGNGLGREYDGNKRDMG